MDSNVKIKKLSVKYSYKDNSTFCKIVGRMPVPAIIRLLIYNTDIVDWMRSRKYIEVSLKGADIVIAAYGEAKKHPDDEDDVHYAKRLAYARAEHNMLKFKHDLFYKLVDELDNIQLYVGEWETAAETAAYYAYKHTKDVLGESVYGKEKMDTLSD